jgi:purine-binding chemotaxis protein CheW
MDIMGIRKKAKKGAGATQTPTSTTSTPTGATTPPAASTAPQPAYNEGRPHVPNIEVAGVDAPLPLGKPPGTLWPQPAFEDRRLDPLAEFLASYDEGDLFPLPGDDDEVAVPLEEARRFLAFDLAGESYAASIMEIREILKLVTLTEVPRAPDGVLGVLSKRGVVMPVVDLASLMGLREPERGVRPEHRILVAGDGERVCGFRVDVVREVVRLSPHEIEEVPPSLGPRQAQLLAGLGRTRDRMFILLDIQAVLDAFALEMGLEVKGADGGP